MSGDLPVPIPASGEDHSEHFGNELKPAPIIPSRLRIPNLEPSTPVPIPASGPSRPPYSEVLSWVEARLANGPVRSKFIRREVTALAMSWNDAVKAKNALGIISMREVTRGNPPWNWWNPKTSRDESVEWQHGQGKGTGRPREQVIPPEEGAEVTLEDLPHLTYATKEDKFTAMRLCQKYGIWDGEFGLRMRRDRYRTSGLKPMALCWQAAAKDLIGDVHSGVVKSSWNPKSLRRSTDDAGIIERLSVLGKDRSSNPRDELRWVVVNVPKAWPDVEESGVPSEYAVSFLVLAKENRSDFLKIVAAKMIPARLEDDDDRGFVDDGRTMELLESQIKELSEDLSRTSSRELKPVPIIPSGVKGLEK